MVIWEEVVFMGCPELSFILEEIRKRNMIEEEKLHVMQLISNELSLMNLEKKARLKKYD